MQACANNCRLNTPWTQQKITAISIAATLHVFIFSLRCFTMSSRRCWTTNFMDFMLPFFLLCIHSTFFTFGRVSDFLVSDFIVFFFLAVIMMWYCRVLRNQELGGNIIMIVLVLVVVFVLKVSILDIRSLAGLHARKKR